MPRIIVRDEFGNASELRFPKMALVWLALIGCLVTWVLHARAKYQDAATAAALATQQRVAQGAYIDRTKAISPTEELSLVVIPSEYGKLSDVRCLVYKNREFQTVTFTCPDAKQDQLEDGPTP